MRSEHRNERVGSWIAAHPVRTTTSRSVAVPALAVALALGVALAVAPALAVALALAVLALVVVALPVVGLEAHNCSLLMVYRAAVRCWLAVVAALRDRLSRCSGSE